MPRIDRDEADGEIFVEVFVRADVAAAHFQPHFNVKLAAFAHSRDVHVAVEHFDVGIGLDLTGEDLAGLIRGETNGLGALAHHLERHLLEVKDDVGGILNYARNRAEFVIDAFDANRGNGRAFNARKQNTAERVADCGAESALERLSGELPEPLGERLGICDQTFGFLEALKHAFFTPITAWLYLNPLTPVMPGLDLHPLRGTAEITCCKVRRSTAH